MRKKSANERYRERKAQHLCTSCGRQDARTLAGKILCERCRKVRAARDGVYYQLSVRKTSFRGARLEGVWKTMTEWGEIFKLPACKVRQLVREGADYTDLVLAGVRYQEEYRKKNSLCWDCANSGKECSWMHDFTPVEGWNAKPTNWKMQTDDGYIEVGSYHVYECPLFRPFNKECKCGN